MKYHHVVTKDLATFGLSMAAGLGLILIVLALAGSVMAGEAANATVSLAVTVGIALLFIGIAGWLVVVQPWRRFDDINLPAAAEPHHGPAHSTTGTAVVVHDAPAQAVEPAQH